MPGKRKLPRNAKHLIKGTRKADYEPEVIREYERDKNRQYREATRKRQRHAGIRDVTFALGKDARDRLDALSKERGVSKTKIITHLLLEK